jgi:hypothetical protein
VFIHLTDQFLDADKGKVKVETNADDSKLQAQSQAPTNPTAAAATAGATAAVASNAGIDLWSSLLMPRILPAHFDACACVLHFSLRANRRSQSRECGG